MHENRGLNPHIEDITRRLALASFMAFAPDVLTSVGGYPGDDYKGGQLFATVDNAKKIEDFVAAALWLKSLADCTGKIGVTGLRGGAESRQCAARGTHLCRRRARLQQRRNARALQQGRRRRGLATHDRLVQ